MRRSLLAPPAHMHGKRDGERNEREDGEAGKRKQDKNGIEDDAPDLNGLHNHLAKIDRFGG
jgi:hypothetical protein